MTLVNRQTNPCLAAANVQRGAMACGQQGHVSVQRWQKHQRGAGFQA